GAPLMQQSLKDKVFLIADRLTKDGLKVSARAILAESGGSMSDVARHYREWRHKQELANKVDAEVSESLLNEIKREIAKHLHTRTQQLQRALEEAGDQERDLLNFLNAAEQKQETLQRELGQTQESFSDYKQQSLQKMAVYEEKICAHQARERDLEAQRRKLQDSFDVLRTEALNSQLHAKQTQTEVDQLREQVQAMTSERAALEQQRNEARMAAAVSNAHREELDMQKTSLQAELSELKQEYKNLGRMLTETQEKLAAAVQDGNNTQKELLLAEQKIALLEDAAGTTKPGARTRQPKN
ncbi:DNA-binding protein, partial [Geoalkalibacter halelectricus]|uniref:DNA-binding protein n=1 Tax=Geoalkalibacter halelectricus TaxID=2847045 RepID=UPI003D1C9956